MIEEIVVYRDEDVVFSIYDDVAFKNVIKADFKKVTPSTLKRFKKVWAWFLNSFPGTYHAFVGDEKAEKFLRRVFGMELNGYGITSTENKFYKVMEITK